MYKILCYGDSNTWGRIPQGERYNEQERWTYLLAHKLGDKYEIYEEGLSGRLTNIDDPNREGRNGLVSIEEVIKDYENSIDLVILSLGTGDFKSDFKRSPQIIIDGIIECKTKFEELLPNVKVLMLIPATIKDHVEDALIQQRYQGATEKNKIFNKKLVKYCKSHDCSYININDFAESSDVDGRHLDKNAHKLVAEKLANYIYRHQ